MKTLYIRSPSGTPPSPSNEQPDLQQFYDEEEQMEMVETYYQNASVQYKIYSYSVGIVSGLCSLLFLYFALIGEDFGESIGMERIRLVHTLSSIGLLTLSIRCFYRYTIWKQSTINYLLMNNNSNFTYHNNNNNNNLLENTDLNLNNSNLSLKSGDEGFNSFVNNNLNNRSSNTSAYFATPSTILTDHPMDDGESSVSHHSHLSTPSQVIENSNNMQVIGNLKIPQILFICLFISILVAAFELLLWAPSMVEHYQLLTQVGAPLGREHFKLAILVFPFVLPIMIVASEYGHFLLNQNFVDIIDLNNHRYKFKKL